MPLLVLLAGQSVFYAVLGLTNLMGVIGTFARWPATAWRSGNVRLIESAIGKGHLHAGDPHVWALGVVMFATLAEFTVAEAFGESS